MGAGSADPSTCRGDEPQWFEMASKQPYTFHIELDQLAKLKVISEASRGKPKISGLVRDAIDDLIEAAAKDEPIAEALRRAQHRPRLMAVGQNPIKERGKR